MHHAPEIPFMIVGTKSDLRTDEQTIERLSKQDKTVKSFDELNELATEIGAVKYMECSARTMEGLNEVFDEAMRIVLKDR